MKIDKIIPCRCCDHEPNSGDSIYYGMPQLKVCGGGKSQLYEAYCPVCGIGGCGRQFKSVYLALKNWNELQERLRKIDNLFIE